MTFRNISVRFSTNAPAYAAQVAAASAATRDFAHIARTLPDASREASASIGRLGLAAGAALTAAFVASGAAAIGFETRMRNVATISADVRQNFGEVSAELIGMTRRLPQSANQLAEGLYDVASSGFAGRDGLVVVEQAAIGASAGLSSTAVAARGLTAVLNAYGLAARDAADVNDILFQTVNLGVITFEELASNLGDFVGLAAVMKVPFDDAAAALATMTRVGISAAESSTSLNRVLQSLLDPSDELASMLARLGHESGQAAIDALGLQGVMDLLRRETGGNAAEMQRLFPEIRALRGALALTADEGRVYNEVAAGITDESARAQAAQLALAEQARSTGYQLRLAANSVLALALGLGNALLPIIRPVAATIQTIALGFSELPGPVRLVAGVFAALAAITLTLGGAFLLIAPRLAAARAALAGLTIGGTAASTALGTLATRIGLVAGAVGIAVAVWSLWNARKARSKQIAEELSAAMLAERQGVEGSTNAWIVNRLAKTNALKEAERLGVATKDLIAFVRGEITDIDHEGDIFEGTEMFEGLRKVRGELEKHTPAARALAEAHKDVAQATGETVPVSAEARAQIAQLGGQMSQTATEAEELSDSAKALSDGLNKFIDLGDALSTTNERLGGFVSASGVFAAVAEENSARARSAAERQADAYNESLERSTDATREAARDRAQAIRDAAEGGTPEIKRAAREQAEAITSEADAIADANKRTRRSWEDFASGSSVSLAQFTDRLRAESDRQDRYMADLASLTQRYGSQVTDALRDMGTEGVDLVRQMASSTGPAVDEVARQLARLAPEARQSFDAFEAEVTAQLAARVNFENSLRELARRGHVAFARELGKMGPEAAGLAADAVRQTDEALSRLEGKLATRGTLAGKAHATNFDLGVFGLLPRIAEKNGRVSVEQLAKEFNVAPSRVREAMQLVAAEIDTIRPNLSLELRFGFNPNNLLDVATTAVNTVRGWLGLPPEAAPASTAPAAGQGTRSRFRTPWDQARRRHSGGHIAGPGDEVPIIAQRGEYVINRMAVAKVGLSTLEGINRMHAGGVVAPVAASGIGGDAILAELRALREIVARVAGPPVDARMTNHFHGSEMPTQAELDYTARRQELRLATAVRR